MALNAAIRRSCSLSPRVVLLLGGRRTVNHHFSRVLVNHTRKINSNNSSLVYAVSRSCFSSSSASALTRPSSDESLLRVIDSEIQCSEENIEEVYNAFILEQNTFGPPLHLHPFSLIVILW